MGKWIVRNMQSKGQTKHQCAVSKKPQSPKTLQTLYLTVNSKENCWSHFVICYCCSVNWPHSSILKPSLNTSNSDSFVPTRNKQGEKFSFGYFPSTVSATKKSQTFIPLSLEASKRNIIQRLNKVCGVRRQYKYNYVVVDH